MKTVSCFTERSAGRSTVALDCELSMQGQRERLTALSALDQDNNHPTASVRRALAHRNGTRNLVRIANRVLNFS